MTSQRKKSGKKTFAQSALRILQNRLYSLRTKFLEVSDVLARSKCLVGIPDPLFYTFRRRFKNILWFKFTTQLKIFSINSLFFNQSLVNKKMDLWACDLNGEDFKQWQKAHVCPVFKKDDTADRSNYRPMHIFT